MRIVQVFKQGGKTIRRVYNKKPGRPKGTKNSSYNLTADGLARKQKAARKVAIRLHKEGRAGSGHFKYYEYPESAKQKCSLATSSLIQQGILNPAENIRKFIKAGGSKRYWNSRVNYGTHGMFYSKKNKRKLRYDSSWELERMQFLERKKEVSSYQKNPVQIPYELDGEAHYYFPDFMVTYTNGLKVLEEVKPKDFLNFEVNKKKFRAAKLFCKALGIKFKVLSSKKQLMR